MYDIGYSVQQKDMCVIDMNIEKLASVCPLDMKIAMKNTM